MPKRKPQVFAAPPADAAAYTINEFCFLGRFGRDKFYEELRSGKFKTVRIGRRRLIPANEASGYFAAFGLEVRHVPPQR
jgi:hypothetical protein